MGDIGRGGAALSVTGPILRSTGVPWDLRRTMPYLAYDKLDFDVIVGTYGDNFDRYSVRLNEIRESIKMIRQIADMMPPGDFRVQDRKVTPPPAPASTRAWRRSSTTSRSSPRASGFPRARSSGGESPRRAGLLHGLRRHLEAIPHAHPCPELVNLQALPLLLAAAPWRTRSLSFPR